MGRVLRIYLWEIVVKEAFFADIVVGAAFFFGEMRPITPPPPNVTSSPLKTPKPP